MNATLDNFVRKLTYITGVLAATFVVTSTAQAGYLVTDATVTRVTNTANNQSSFSVYVSGGTGPCASAWISFPLTAASDADTHKRAFATLMSAFTLGMRVSIYNYASDACDGASFVDVHQ